MDYTLENIFIKCFENFEKLPSEYCCSFPFSVLLHFLAWVGEVRRSSLLSTDSINISFISVSPPKNGDLVVFVDVDAVASAVTGVDAEVLFFDPPDKRLEILSLFFFVFFGES